MWQVFNYYVIINGGSIAIIINILQQMINVTILKMINLDYVIYQIKHIRLKKDWIYMVSGTDRDYKALVVRIAVGNRRNWKGQGFFI